MKSTLVFFVAACLATTAFAGDCSSSKMKPTDASAPTSTKLADAPRRLQEAAKVEHQAPKQQLAQSGASSSPGGR